AAGAGGGNTYVTQNFSVGDIASMAQVKQAVAGSERRIAAYSARSQTYGSDR
ncbi:MAG: hypothetical protein JWQ11_3487, partial [Rhizobacter sp.]|nr:hypothetical protein [Rhizobacter sp.]